MCSKSAQSFIKSCVFLRFLRGFCSNKQQGARYCWRANSSMHVQNSKSFSIQGPQYIFYNIISRITLDLRSMLRVIAFGFRVRLVWNARCLCCVHVAQSINSVCVIDRDRQHCGRAMTFLLGGGYVISFWQAAVSFLCSLLIFPKGFLWR